MQIKRFEAKNMTTALAMVKNELGSDAVILSARSLRKGRGLFGSMKYAGVEVTAAIDNDLTALMDNRASTHKDRVPQVKRAFYGVPKDGETKGLVSPAVKTGEQISGAAKAIALKKLDAKRDSRGLAAFYRQMLAQEVDRGIASELVEEIKRIPACEELLASGAILPHLVSILEELGVAVEARTPCECQSGVQAFIGPTGVGKTTTIAKLAAQHAIRQRCRVALVSLDNYGIAAREHLSTYAKLIRVPMEIAVNASELREVLKKFNQQDLILIDTPGINPHEQGHVTEIKNYFENVTDLDIHLVLSATTKEKDLFEIVSKLRDIPVHRVLFTKVDESNSFGNILNVLIRTKLPLSYFTGGRKVPDDIEAGTLSKLLDLIFQLHILPGSPTLTCSNLSGGGPATGQMEKTGQQPFIANKNSDVYHYLDCNWAKKIKPDHVVKFTSAKDAEFQNFLPCRSCNPNRIQSVGTIESRREKMNISSNR